MSREGTAAGGLLYDLHADTCDGTEYSALRPVVVPIVEPSKLHRIEVVYLAWCGECGAADYAVV